MEFHGNISEILPGVVNVISADRRCGGLIVGELTDDSSVVDSSKDNWTHKCPSSLHEKSHEWNLKQKQLSIIIDELGYCSAMAQGLTTPITTAMKLLNSDHRLYIMCGLHMSCPVVIGMIKVAMKNLFLFDESHHQNEKIVLSLMDFYVVENVQRQNYGRKLFHAMVEVEQYHPCHMAYDAPSFKLLAFLKKHYNLTERLRQPNRFVIFKDFFYESDKCSEALSLCRKSVSPIEHNSSHMHELEKKHDHSSTGYRLHGTFSNHTFGISRSSQQSCLKQILEWQEYDPEQQTVSSIINS